MSRTNQDRKADTFNFRIDPALKAAFTTATQGENKPAARVLRDFMRAYVARAARRRFAAEARRQSAAIARRSRDPSSDEQVSLKELEALFDEDLFESEWSA